MFFLGVKLWEFFAYSWYRFFVGYVIYKYILPFCSLFILLPVSFTEQKFSLLIKSCFSIFSLWIVPFVSCLRTLCLKLGHEYFLLDFIWKFYGFNINSVIHFEFVFVEGVKFLRFFFFFAYGCPVVLKPFVEKYTFSTKLLLHLCQKSIGLICVGLFLYLFLYSISLSSVSVPLSIPNCLYFCCFIVSLKNR